MPATPICRFAAAAAVALFAVFQPAAASAQTMLRLDGESCREELKLAGTLFGGEINGAGARPFAGRCIASQVRAGARGGEISAARLTWSRGAIRALSEGRLPGELVLGIEGGALAAGPGAEAFLQAISANARQRRGFSGEIRLTHDAQSRRLTLHRGVIRFDDGSALTLSADLSGAGPLLASRPRIGALALGIERLELEMTAPPGVRHPVLKAILAAAGANNPGLDVKGLKGEAGRFLGTRMAGALGPQELRAALAFIDDAPRLSRPLRLGMQSDAGLALTRLAAFNGSAAGEDILAGSTITLDYDP